ncbi:MAG TPA: ABC transporter permease [Puia sp.]|nr:ABC transporter permease [Puia sp.]
MTKNPAPPLHSAHPLYRYRTTLTGKPTANPLKIKSLQRWHQIGGATIMFKNYFITSWRNLIRDKSYSSFNILGLAVGMGVALLIGLWVQYQYSYDRWLLQYKQAYRLMVRSTNNGQVNAGYATQLPLANVLKKEVPEIRYVAQADWFGQHDLVVKDKKFYTSGGFVGEDFLQIFPYPLLEGNAAEVLREPASIVLTRSTAIALFGNEDPINKTIRLDNAQEVKVTGVLADVPANSSLQFRYLLPFSFYIQTQDWIRQNVNTWNLDPIQTFVALQPGTTMDEVAPKLRTVLKKYDSRDVSNVKMELFLHPLSDWHLRSNFENGYESGGFIDYVKMFALIGLVVLIIACINFVNLSTAKSERRAREVGVRKAIGSLRKDIMLQFLVEAFVITLIAFGLALLLVSIALPGFNALTSSETAIPWPNPLFWAAMLGYVLLTSLLAGSRPALYLSALRPVKVLKGGLQAGRAAALPRKILVVLQFTCSVALIISTVIIYRQIQYVKNRPTGYDAGRLLMSPSSADLDHNYAALKNDLLQSGLVTSVTRSTAPVTGLYSWMGVDQWQGKLPGETFGVATVGVTDDYFSTLGMHILKGRDFKKGITEDTTDVILNEAAVKRMRFKDPLNQVITWNGRKKIRVIGVVKDALMQSPFSEPEPVFFDYEPSWSSTIMYKLSARSNTGSAIAKIQAIFDKYNPAYPFQYHFADEEYAGKFSDEELIGKLSGIFSVLAILISCLGLFGLAAYVAQQRTREIGIRKILGATEGQVLVLISREFVFLVIVSCVVASPLAYYFMQGWINGYYYHTPITADVFIYSAAAALLITITTISFQAIRAARRIPIESLRTE